MIGSKGIKAAGAMVAVLLMLLGVFAVPVSATAEPNTVSGKLTTATGTTTDLGGGNYFFVKFGNDAAFGIVWGTNTTLNNVYFVAIKARYLGMAQVYDEQGTPVAENHTIKIYTLYAVKLDDILEFNDTNDNGVLQYHREHANYNFTGDYIAQEPIYKKVDLRTAWTQSEVTSKESEDHRTWSFDLSANNLSYIPLNNYSGPTGDDKLNNLALTFHLEAKMVQVDNVTLPQWRITVQRGMMGNMMQFSEMPDYQISGKIITYHVKWDQSIQGWDFDAANTVNPSLLMEVSALVGNFMPAGVVKWMNMNLVHTMKEDGRMSATCTTGHVDVDENTGNYSTPRPLAAPTLTFGGDRTRIGTLEWVSNVTVDGNQELVHGQILGGGPVWARAMNGAAFAGFAVLAGMSFPGGQSIVHDPTFSSEALVDLGSGTAAKPPMFIFAIGAIIAMIVAIAIVVLILMEKKPGQKVQQSYERTMSSQPGEWAKYYNKK